MSSPYTSKVYERLSPFFVTEWWELWNRGSRSHFFNSPGWTLSLLDAFPEMTICVAAFYDRANLVGVVPYVQHRRFGISVIANPDRPQHYLDRAVILADDRDPELLSLMFRRLIQTHSVFFSDVEERDVHMLQQSPNLPMLVHLNNRCPRNALSVPPTHQMSHRQQKKLQRILEREKSHLSFAFHRDHVAEQLQTIADVESQSHKPRQHTALFELPDTLKLFRSIATLFPQHVAVSILSYDGAPIATKFGLVYHKTYLAWHTTFAENVRALQPGKLLTYLLWQELQRQGFELYDFSKGENPTKLLFASEGIHQYDIYGSSSVLIRGYWSVLLHLKSLARIVKKIFLPH